jgi:hypothetical protein
MSLKVKTKAPFLIILLFSQMAAIANAQEPFKFQLSKSVSETFPEIKETLTVLAKDQLAPGKIDLSTEDFDSLYLTRVTQLLTEKKINVLIGHSSTFSSLKGNQQFMMYPLNPQIAECYFFIVSKDTVPKFISAFSKDNALLHKKGYYLQRFTNLVRKCFVSGQQLSSYEDEKIDRSKLQEIQAVLVKIRGDNAHYPSKHYGEWRERNLGAIKATDYFRKEDMEKIKKGSYADNPINCLNKNSTVLGDDASYTIKELPISSILNVLTKLQIEERFSRDYTLIQAVRRREKVQMVFLKDQENFVKEILDYLWEKYRSTREFYFDKKTEEHQQLLDQFAKTLYHLSPKKDKNALVAIGEVHYRAARKMHRSWDSKEGGEKTIIRKLTVENYKFADTDVDKMNAIVEEYETFLKYRPVDVKPDFVFTYAKHNQALLYHFLYLHHYNRGSCKENTLAISDCKKSNESHMAASELKDEIRTVFADPQNIHLRFHRMYDVYKKKFRNLFGEDLPD